MGISISTLNNWKNKYVYTLDTLKRGKKVVDRQVENALLKRVLGSILKQQDKRALDEFERQAGILGKSVTDPKKEASVIVNASFKNATFSDRIWMYQGMLKSELDKLLQTGLIQGQNPRVLARHLKERFGVSQYNAERLMRTEMARVQTESAKRSMEENEFEEYEFMAEGTACPICRAIDGKHYKVKNMLPGTNAAPMHPNCRCAVTPYMDRKAFENWIEEIL